MKMLSFIAVFKMNYNNYPITITCIGVILHCGNNLILYLRKFMTCRDI